MIVDLDRNKLAMRIVCNAIGSQHELADKMDSVKEGTLLKEIKFIVGGVELNFENVIKAIDRNYDQAVTKAAKELIEEKLSKIDNLLENIHDTINEHVSDVLSLE